MKIALFGSTGMIGTRVLAEAQNRGHDVTPLNSQNSDIFSRERVAQSVTGCDVVISAYGPGPDNPLKLLEATKALLAGVAEAGVPRLLAVSGAGGLEVERGLLLLNSPNLPLEWRAIAQAHVDALALYRNSTLNWTLIAPAALVQPGTRTGAYRTASNQLLTANDGQSHISAEDFAVAVLDEVESPKHPRDRFGVAD